MVYGALKMLECVFKFTFLFSFQVNREDFAWFSPALILLEKVYEARHKERDKIVAL